MIIVTGATGFIGRRLVPILVKKHRNKNILCLIKKSDTQYEKDGRKILSKCKVKTKIIDLDSGYGLKSLPKNISHVYHLAARTDTSEKGHNITNNLGTKKLVKSLNLTSKSHFIYTSTTAFMSGRINCNSPINEKTIPSPTNEYGRSKLAAEKYLLDQSQHDKFNLTILRFPTVYGDNPRKNSFFDLVDKYVRNDSIFSRFNWPGKTSLVHVDDAASILFKLGNKAKKIQEKLFIVSGESLSFEKINEILFSTRKLKYKKIILPRFFWQITAFARLITPFFENIFPRKLYNSIWRAGLLVENVIDCKSVNLPKVLKNYKFKKLKETVTPLVASITPYKTLPQRPYFQIFLIIIILAINLLIFSKISKLSFPDDDWLGILFYKSKLTTTIFNPYGFQHLSFGKLYELVGYKPNYFYLVSIIFRSIASLTISFFVYSFTKNKLGTLLSGILFSVSIVGFETTEVSNNSNTYLTIILALIFVKVFFNYIDKTRFVWYIIGTFSFLISIIIAPIRIYILPLWFFILCFIVFLENRNKKLAMKPIFWFFSIVIITLLLVKKGTFGLVSSASNSFLDSFIGSFKIIFTSLLNGEQKYIRFFATGISNVIIPDSLVGYIKKPIYPEFYMGVFYFLILTLFFVKQLFSKTSNRIRSLIVAFLVWVPLFFLVAWLVWLGREPIIVTYRRYLTVPFAGFCVSVGFIVAYIHNNLKAKLSVVVIVLLLIIFHGYSLNNYIDLIRKYRDNNLEKDLLDEIELTVPSLPRGISYFYFDDQGRQEELYNTLYLGFSTKMAVLYNISIPSTGTFPPHYTTSLEEIRGIVTTGEPLIKHGYQAVPLPLENVFAFRIEGNKLINIKNEIFKD